MTSAMPTYRSQGVNYLGFLAQQLGDLRGIKTLAHELIQNADDAKDESGKLAATRIIFDIRKDALMVHNDAVFRETDFLRMREVASGSKRSEDGERTTGAFGVGFISVYQITDRPEIHSNGRRWVLRPDESEERRIEDWRDSSVTTETGTLFRLPWAFKDSIVRRELKAPPVTNAYIDSFVAELREALPNSILFLKKLERIELRHNGEIVASVDRIGDGNTFLVRCSQEERLWHIFESDFSGDAARLTQRFRGHIDTNRSSYVRVAVSESLLDHGLLYATLPTEQVTGLPFHIDADFFPAADRKSIPFGDSLDHRSEWNRAALKTAANAFASNLITLRDIFRNDPETFWKILGAVDSVHRRNSGNSLMPLRTFWDSLLPQLPHSPVVFAQSGRWLLPGQTRIVTGRDEEAAIPAFRELGMEIVHEKLWGMRNTLTQNRVGVKSISVEDLESALSEKGLYGEPTCIPSTLRDRRLIRLLWQGVHGVLANAQGASRTAAEAIGCEFSLAPGVDGRIWPCRAALQTDEYTQEVFTQLLPDDATFLVEKNVPLFDQLCSEFTVEDAVDVLARFDSDTLKVHWTCGDFQPKVVLQWLDRNKAYLTVTLRNRLAELPIFPSTSGLHSLEDLWLPGGFEDPIGATDLLDVGALPGLLDFLRSLGARELSFEDYARRYIAEAFSPSSAVSEDAKRELLSVLERHIGEIKDDYKLKALFSKLSIVECTDDVFRLPADVYMPSEEIKSVLGNLANYAKLPLRAEGRADLYNWLGVSTSLRLKDVLSVIQASAANQPCRKSKAIVRKMLEVLGTLWTRLSETQRESCELLRTLKWLPAEGDKDDWHRPNELHAAYRKTLFASQAKFIDVPLPLQQRISEFLRYMGLNVTPHARLVVRHLLRCSEKSVPPPSGIYQWLNENANPTDLQQLKVSPCLWVGGRYFSPKQVYWGSHSFGNFRVQLGPELRSFQKLLSSLEVRESPNSDDAMEVLKEVSVEVGSGPIGDEEESVVLQCWVMLTDALNSGVLDYGRLQGSLGDTKCVPNRLRQLHRPSWMFFEDRPSLVDKFPELLKGNVVGRIDRAWIAMEAAGVKPLSQVVHGVLVDTINRRSDVEMRRRILERAILIKSICEDASNGRHSSGVGESFEEILDAIRLVGTDHFTVKWKLEAFDREWPHTPPEQATAHWNSEDVTIYFAQPSDSAPPWSAIAREMAYAVLPEARPASVSPGLKSILEANTFADARDQLIELGISSIEKLEFEPVKPQIAESLDSTSDSANEGSPATSVDDGEPLQDGSAGPPRHDDDSEPAPEDPFAKRFYSQQTASPSRPRHREISLPEGGPLTDDSAKEDTEKSIREGRAGSNVSRTLIRWELQAAAQDLAIKFRSMVHGDYSKRCQICSRSFVVSGGQLQVYVAHVVPPGEDRRTNHFGDLLGLCGWHFSLMRYGEWCFLDPATRHPFLDSSDREGWEQMRDFVTERPVEVDDMGNRYVGLPVRFSNVYRDWNSEPEATYEEIRYSIPHWKYLCELLKS